MEKKSVPMLVFSVVVIFGVLASVFSFVAAGEIFGDEEFGEEAGFFRALGWYFLAKAFFLGPMLALVAYRVLIVPPASQTRE